MLPLLLLYETCNIARKHWHQVHAGLHGASGACRVACDGWQWCEGMHAGCLRRELAPLALNAYPEAYGELKRSLLLLVYGQHEEGTPVRAEWSPRSRSDLAAMLSRTLRQATGQRRLLPAPLSP